MNTTTSQAALDLQAAINDLYAVFSRYPLRAHLVGCAHCFFEADNARLHSAPLREMEERDLKMFSWKTMTTWGDAADFKHFFPRLCELSTISDDTLHFGIDLFGRKLKLAGYPNWPEEERGAFLRFLLAWWTWLLEEQNTGWMKDVSPETLAPYVKDIRPLLEALFQNTTAPGKLFAVVEYKRLYDALDDPKQPFSLAQREQVLAWLTAPGTQEAIRSRMADIEHHQSALESHYEAFANEFFMLYGSFPLQLHWLLGDVRRLLGDENSRSGSG
jgi:hypothetical protein